MDKTKIIETGTNLINQSKREAEAMYDIIEFMKLDPNATFETIYMNIIEDMRDSEEDGEPDTYQYDEIDLDEALTKLKANI